MTIEKQKTHEGQDEAMQTLQRVLEENHHLHHLQYFLDLCFRWHSKDIRKRIKPPVCVIGTDLPEELIHAAGITPYWIIGGSHASTQWSEQIVPRDTDPVSRSILGFVTEKMNRYLVPLKWLMVFLFLGLALVGSSFCNICPAITVSPVLGGMQVSIFLSGFMMIIALVGSFFKRRFWCNICPVGFLLGLAHKVSPFRVTKDVTACTECGACYDDMTYVHGSNVVNLL